MSNPFSAVAIALAIFGSAAVISTQYANAQCYKAAGANAEAIKACKEQSK